MSSGSTCTIDSHVLQLPVGHALSEIMKVHPYYDKGPWAVIAEMLRMHNPNDFTLLDIGANVGDSLRYFKSFSSGKAICVEAASHFAEYCRQNSSDLENVSIVEALMVPSSAVGKVAYEGGSQTGTTVLINGVTNLNPQEAPINHVTEKDIVSMLTGKVIIKSDTDGFDAEIISAFMDQIDLGKLDAPVIFFEGPSTEQIIGRTYQKFIELVGRLHLSGFKLLFFTNFGFPYCYADSSYEASKSIFLALEVGFRAGRPPCHYLDVLAFDSKLGIDVGSILESVYSMTQ